MLNEYILNLNTEDKYFFDLLKQAVSSTFLKGYNASKNIEAWSGSDIVAFQEDLFSKLKTNISEKWFYTYFKNNAKKLPRIDMLNMLSKYVGYDNWYHFKKDNNTKPVIKTRKKIVLMKLLFIPFFLISAFAIQQVVQKNEFHFCFIDDTKNEAITGIPIEIKVIQNNESPIYLKTDSTGCFTFKTKDEILKFVVNSPYYKTDTIIRHIDSNKNSIVKLQTDNYALMLHYYTNGNLKDWKKSKAQLNTIIADDAEIYQLFEKHIGIEVHTKEEFIRKLTTPVSSLKRIEILDKVFKNGKVVELKFIIR